MNELNKIASSIICSALNQYVKVDNEYVANPESYYSTKFRITSSLIAVIIGRKCQLYSEKISIEKLKIELSSIDEFKCLLDEVNFLNSAETLLLEKFIEAVSFLNPKDIDLSTFYECLLTVEFPVIQNSIGTIYDKSSRNKLGSYYTPQNLADQCVRIAIDNYLEINIGVKQYSKSAEILYSSEILKILSDATFCDYSCGPGRFLIAVVRYYDKYVFPYTQKSKHKKILRCLFSNIYAIDIDPIALEIAKVELLLAMNMVGENLSNSNHYIHGNPLVRIAKIKSPEKRIELFKKGFIYHENLGLSESIYKEVDVIIGNPPWEKIRHEDRGFFKSIAPKIAELSRKNDREKSIQNIKKNQVQLYQYYLNHKLSLEKCKLMIKKDKKFFNSNSGELNTYALFTELAEKHSSKYGVIGLILKSAIVTSQVNKKLFCYLLNSSKIRYVFDFINSSKIFDIDGRERFCFLVLGKNEVDGFNFVTNLTSVNELITLKNIVKIKKKHLEVINPLTKMLPNTKDKMQLKTLLHLYNKNCSFDQMFKTVKFGRIVHFTNHTTWISKEPKSGLIPIYEGKFIYQYDGRYSGFNNIPIKERYGSKISSKRLTLDEKFDSAYMPESRYFIDNKKWKELSKNYTEDYCLLWRSLTSATNQRTCIATILPFVPCSQSVQFLQLPKDDLVYLLAIFNSIAFDYILRIKLSGIDLTQSIIRQMPVPNKNRLKELIFIEGEEIEIRAYLYSKVLSLLYNDIRLKPFVESFDVKVTTILDENLRRKLKREIDFLILYLYDVKPEEVDVITQEFPKDYSIEDRVNLKNLLDDQYVFVSN